MPWILGVIALVLATFALHAPGVCPDAASRTATLSVVSANTPVVSITAPDITDPCQDATARGDAPAARLTAVYAADPAPTRPAVAASAAVQNWRVGGPATTSTRAAASSRPPLGLAVAHLSVARI